MARPVPAQTDDGNPWVDGPCWLWCGHQNTRVLWLGPVSASGAHAPFYACGPCLALLHHSVWDYVVAQDRLPQDEMGFEIPLYRPPADREVRPVHYRRGRHRRPRFPLGRRFLRAITSPAEIPHAPPLPAEQETEPYPPRAEESRQGAGHHRYATAGR